MIGVWLQEHAAVRWALIGIAVWNVGVILWRRREVREMQRMLDRMKASSVVGVATTEAPCRRREHVWDDALTRLGSRRCVECDAIEGCPCNRCNSSGGCPGPSGDEDLGRR